MVDSNRQPAKLIIQVSGPSDVIPQFDVDVLENGHSILDRLALDPRPGIVEVFGLFAGQVLEVVVSAKGFLTQRRSTVLAPADNDMYFALGKRGMQFYVQQGVPIPYRRSRARHLVIRRAPVVAERGALSPALKKLIQRDQRLESKPLEAGPPAGADKRTPRGKAAKARVRRGPWQNPLVAADLIVHGEKDDRKAAIGGLARHLRKHPEEGQLVVLIHGNDKSGPYFTGEIDVTFKKLLSAAELAAFEQRYQLTEVRRDGAKVMFAMLYPDADFPDLIAAIKKEYEWVEDADPVIEAPVEPTIRIMPTDFLFPEQWDFQILQMPEAWFALNGIGANLQFGSNNIVIAVADPQGPQMAHPDLAGNVNGVAKTFASFDFGANAAAYALTGTHGTRCASAATAAANRVAAANAAFTEGLTGSAPGCLLVGVHLTGVTTPGLGEMFRWYSGSTTPNPAQLARSVDISSNSFRSRIAAPLSPLFEAMLQFASDFGRSGRGVAVFFSAANDNALIAVVAPAFSNQIFALSKRVMTVASTTLLTAGTREGRAQYSNFGPEVAFCSPSSDRPDMVPILHAPPNSWGGLTATVTNAAAAAAGFAADGNMPAAPGLNAGVPIQQPLNAPTLAGSPTLITTSNTAPFAAASAVMVGAPGALNAEGLQLTGIVAASNQLNVAYSGPVPNSQQPHLGAAPIAGGDADYCSNHGETSYSTPVVAGIAALILSARPTLSWVEVREIISMTSRKVNVGETNVSGLWRNPALPPPNTVLDAALTNVWPKSPNVSTTLAANAVAPSSAQRHLNHGQSTLSLTNAAGFEIGDAIRISDGVNTDFHVIEGKAGNTITIDALRRNYGTAPVTTLTAGVIKPVRSDFYGFGRVNAWLAVQAAIAYSHADRDLMIRNHLADTGLVDTNPAVVPIHSPDIWLRNQNDPPMPAPPYDQPGPHQNPVTGNNRFIYARIKNIGQRLANLDAWVHFYVALSDELPPPVDPVVNPAPGIVTPFLFPGDPGSAIAGIAPRSWCDIPANDIIPPMGIGTGARNVYHVRDLTVLNQFNQLIPAGSVAPADPANINTGVTVVRAQWNQADLPPAGTIDAVYLLVYVSPVDGLRQGREAGRHNNMSSREIAFADFDLFDNTGAAPLPSSVLVDAFGTPKTTPFQIRVTQTIGAFTTERVQIEITRTNDNGSTDRAIFRQQGAAWQLRDQGGAAVTWAHLTAPVVTGSANPAAGRQTNITFAGDFACALQHQKVSFRAVIHSARAGAVLVPIAEESFDVQVIAELPPTPSASASDPNPPQPDSFVFTDFATLGQPQPADKSFGPIDADKFRVTSVFRAATAPKAYAVSAGVVMVQQVDADRVNLVLRPLQQPGLGMTPVKYYIYRGLRLEHFLDPANHALVRPQAGAPEFVARLWPIHLAQNPPAAPFSSAALGFDPANQPDTATIDQFFFASGSSTQYALAKAGEWLGDFFHTGNNEFGFEIVLEEGTAQPTFQNIRQATHIIDVSALPATNDAERFTKRLAQEEILNYMDPAAFYGMHFDGTVRQKPNGTWTDQAIVTNVLNKFATKNAVYLDIRNENGNSYNFYGNYKGPLSPTDPGGNIRFGTAEATLTADTYGTQGWPVHIVRLPTNTPATKNPLVIELRVNDNLKPVLYVEHGEITSATVNNVFVDETRLFTPPPISPPWTDPIAFQSPNTGTGAKPSIAWVFKLHYGRQVDPATTFPPTVVPTAKTLDNLFGPLDLAPLWTGGQAVRWIAAQDRKYVDGQAQGFGQMMERGVAYEGTLATGRVIFFAALTDQLRNVIAGFTPRRGVTGGTSEGRSFLQAARRFDQYRLDFGAIADGATTVTTLRLRPGTTSEPTLASGVLFLGLTSAELNRLQGLTGLNNKYPRTIFFEELPGPFAGFRKFKLGVQGLKADDTSDKVMPAAGQEVFAYTTNALHFYSDAFSADEPLPTTYVRNAEESVGQMNLEYPGAANFALHSVVSGGNGQFNVARDLRQLIALHGTFQITGSPNNSGTYTVTGIGFSAAAGVTTLTVANVPGNSASGSLQLLPRKIEDHFLELDPPTAIAGTNPMKAIVDGFSATVAAVPNDAGAAAVLQGHVNTFGLQALARARATVRDNNHANADDRPLYWARLKMQAILKSHAFLIQRFVEGATLVQSLEARTRGLDPAPSFAGAGANRRVLLVGFDPFRVRPGATHHNSHYSNPAAVAALFLHGNATAVPGMFIQSVILPVRFEDFDAGMVDNLVDNYLQGANQANMILTLGYNIDLSIHVERFATRFRSPSVADNLNVLGQPAVHYELNAAQTALQAMAGNVNLPRYLETTLPVARMVPGSPMAAAPTGTQAAKTVLFDQRFTLAGAAAPQGVENNQSAFAALAPPPNTEVEQGSAGNFLAKEVFYRIAWRRTQRNTTLKTGHVQLPKLQSDAAERNPLFDASRVQYFLDTIVQVLRDALPGL